MRKFKMLILSISACLLCGCGQVKEDTQESVESSKGTAVEMTEATAQPTTAPTPEQTMVPPQETEGPKEILIESVVLDNEKDEFGDTGGSSVDSLCDAGRYNRAL